MLKNFKEKYTLIYAIIVVLLFKGGQMLGSFIITDLIKTLPVNEDVMQYIYMIFNDFIVALIMIILLACTNRIGLLKKKGKGYFKSLPIAAYPIGFAILAFFGNVAYAMHENVSLNEGFAIIIFIVCMFFVGLSEELCNRAISAESLLEHYGTDKKGIWKAAIISGILFGCLHLFNLKYGDPIKVTVQVIAAAATGVLYAAIYFRSGNIWLMVTLHALHDIAAAAGYGIFSRGNVTNMLAYSGPEALYGLITVIPQVIVAIFLLRKSKIDEVKTYWPEIKK